MADFKVGDVVRLKSGGPDMTIIEIYGDSKNTPNAYVARLKHRIEGDLVCRWFDSGKQTVDFFGPNEVVLIPSGQQ